MQQHTMADESYNESNSERVSSEYNGPTCVQYVLRNMWQAQTVVEQSVEDWVPNSRY